MNTQKRLIKVDEKFWLGCFVLLIVMKFLGWPSEVVQRSSINDLTLLFQAKARV
jgi:hypothetical protein